MTATPTPPPPPSYGRIPWRVKTRVNRATWFGPAMTEAEAVEAAAATAAQCRDIGDGGTMIPVPTRYGVTAWVRGRDIVSIEPVGPRWDGIDDNDRPAGAVVPGGTHVVPAPTPGPERVPAAPDGVPGPPELAPAGPGPDDDADHDDVPAGLSAGQRWLQTRSRQQASRIGRQRR